MFRKIGSLNSVSRRLIQFASMSRVYCTTVLPTLWLSCDDGDASRNIFILMHLNKQLQRFLIHKVPVTFSYKPWNCKLNRSLRIMMKFRMELLNFSTWAYLKNHGGHIVELLYFLAWSAGHGHCINMNKWFENILEFKANFTSLKLPLQTVKLSRVSRPSCNVFGSCFYEQKFQFAKPNQMIWKHSWIQS